ncbi:MAG: monofunctional biosynthetic peptidoglycan transglycosylase [Micropepsaceae bacterium]
MLWHRSDGIVPWVRRLLICLVGIVVALPVTLILIFRFVPPPPTPLMIGMHLSGVSVTRDWVPLNAISPALVKAVIASEDGKFCSHRGFDWDAIQEALDYNAQGQGVRGASTISQQTAKNLFLPPARTWLRKGAEAYLTVLLEALWPKKRIMEAYLNIVELGEGNFGVEAAAQNYFGKSAAELSRDEAARLAAVLPNPRGYRVMGPGAYVVRRTNQIASMMDEVTRDRLDGCITLYAPRA